MESLVKTMFFIPNRLRVFGNQMYVSFNIAVIPTDMEVVSMMLYVPMSAKSVKSDLYLYKIDTAWDEQSIEDVRPTYIRKKKEGHVSSVTKEGRFNLKRYMHDWRFDSLENHGVFLRSESSDPLTFSVEDPPYLIVKTL